MREFKIARDIAIVVACIFVISHILLLHAGGKDARLESANRLINRLSE